MGEWGGEEGRKRKMNSEQKRLSYPAVLERVDVMTGGADYRKYLYYQLKMSMARANAIDIVVSFLMESGVRMLLKDLKHALGRGAKVRLLTGNYLGITQPGALYLLKKELNDQIDLRLYQEKDRSFHPKAYIFHWENGSEIYIGSSNISRSALTSGIEWNYRFERHRDPVNFMLFYEEFENLFYHHAIKIDDKVLKDYSKSWKKPVVQKELSQYEEAAEDFKTAMIYEPRGAQIEALYALRSSREEGAKRALIYAATGVGKTLMAAFDSAAFQHVLFIAHRQEILKQAAYSFRNVRQSDDQGFFDQKRKDTDKPIIFASVSTLGKEEYLQEKYFSKEYFDYIVIDEFHHAVNENYMRIIRYFRPQFLLGLTATPERMDGRNIYEICDYNVPYQIGLKDAVNKGMLVPFHYYGIYDKTVDYSQMRVIKGKYQEKELNEKYDSLDRYELIYRHYRKYRSKRALGFCCSRIHAENMARNFNSRGVPSAAVYSNADGDFSENREIAVQKLKDGEIKVIFSVDMFNEGVDICDVDMVMFLRPTESSTVFLQQLGRGLRRGKDKEFLNVLDFIGNYEKAGNAPFLLSGQTYSRENAVHMAEQEFEYPDDCIVDFDLQLIDIFQEMAKKNIRIRDRIRGEYERVKEFLDGKVPSRVELFTYMEDEIYQLCMRNFAENPFRRYLEFLHNMGELNIEQEEIYNGIGREFLRVLETTSMSKSYKLPVLIAFYNGGDVKMEVSEEDIYQSYQKFYSMGMNWKDLEKDKSTRDYKKWDLKRCVKEAKKNPVRFLTESGKGFFVEREGCVLGLREELRNVIKLKEMAKQMWDVIACRMLEYYRKRHQEVE